jgi:hypothetical protein
MASLKLMCYFFIKYEMTSVELSIIFRLLSIFQQHSALRYYPFKDDLEQTDRTIRKN